MNLRRPMMFYFVVAAVLGAVAGLSFSAQSLAASFPRSPEDVLTQFCELDAKGVRLTDEGWRKAAALFADPEPPSKKHVFVIKDFVVSNPTTKEDKAELYVEYIYVGELDPFLSALFRSFAATSAQPGQSQAGVQPGWRWPAGIRELENCRCSA